jgi:hypothetical protein
MAESESQFDQAMFDVYRRAKAEAKYNATIFLQMLTDNGGVRTAKTLINAPKPSDGYTALYERGRLDLTVEAVVIENERWPEPMLEMDSFGASAVTSRGQRMGDRASAGIWRSTFSTRPSP